MTHPTDTIEQYDWEKQHVIDEKLYQRGMNDGYIIGKHEPNLAESMSKTFDPNKDVYQCGFIEGKKQWQMELSLQRTQEMQRIRNKGKDRANDRER